MVPTPLKIFGADTKRPLEIGTVVLPRAVSTALFAPIIFHIAQKLHQSTAPVHGSQEGAR